MTCLYSAGCESEEEALWRISACSLLIIDLGMVRVCMNASTLPSSCMVVPVQGSESLACRLFYAEYEFGMLLCRRPCTQRAWQASGWGL